MTMLVLVVVMFGGVLGADLVIRIPGDLSQQDGFYRLNYRWDTVGHMELGDWRESSHCC